MLDEAACRLVVREVEELDDLLRSSSDLLPTPVAANPSFERLAALATVLTSFYTGLERIFERIAAQLDPVQPEGDHWHIELLSQVARPTKNRPARSAGLASVSDGMCRRGRHDYRLNETGMEVAESKAR